MDRIIAVIDGFTHRIGKTVMWLSLAIVLLVACDVGMRYFLNKSYVMVRELEWHIYALLFLLAAGYTLKEDAHVRVDVLYQHFSPRMRAAVNAIGCLIFLFPGCFLILKTSIPFVQYAWQLGEVSPDPGGLPARWLLKAAIPFSFCLIAMQGVSFFLKNVKILFGMNTEGGA